MTPPPPRACERILGHGIDLVEVERFARLLSAHGDHALDRLFTPAERAYAGGNPHRRAEHLAARFAAKEAALKALGTGWARGIAWTDLEVNRNTAGRPELAVTGVAGDIARDLGVTRWTLSLTHVRGLAAASVLALGDAT